MSNATFILSKKLPHKLRKHKPEDGFRRKTLFFKLFILGVCKLPRWGYGKNY